jgi:hypothetical protein
MKLAVWLSHPRGERLPKTLVSTSWAFDGLTVPEALRKVADQLELPGATEDDPPTPLVEHVVVWLERTDR